MPPRKEEALRRYQRQYEELKTEVQSLGYVLQGSLAERWMECGKAACRCHSDPHARHGPYYQWSWKSRGKTISVYLDKESATLCKLWVTNNRRLEQVLRRMRALSLRVARLHEIRQ